MSSYLDLNEILEKSCANVRDYADHIDDNLQIDKRKFLELLDYHFCMVQEDFKSRLPEFTFGRPHEEVAHPKDFVEWHCNECRTDTPCICFATRDHRPQPCPADPYSEPASWRFHRLVYAGA
jgi:hypothetical protein